MMPKEDIQKLRDKMQGRVNDLKDDYDNRGDKEPDVYGHEWEIDCPSCGVFTFIQKDDPVTCPKCGSTEIDTVRV